MSLRRSEESMTCIYTSRLYFALLFLILCFQRCCSASAPSVQCKIVNFEHVECIWEPNTINYTFSSAFVKDDAHEDCPKYKLEKTYTVGCEIPLKKHDLKFQKFHISLSTEGNHNISKTFQSLQRNVQLNPPCNLSAMWNEHSDTLSLYWNSTTPFKKKCIVYMLCYQKGPSQCVNVTETSYSLSQVSQNKLYVFQVRSTVAELCGSSDLWSDWSVPVEWRGTGNSTWFYAVLTVSLLSLLGLLLWFCERKKILFLPVVPDPSKNLQDLFHKHDGNVESWIHISKELKEAFQPDYTEPSCDVSEVLPSCDSGPKPEACLPPPQTDNCDKANTEEEPAELQSS